MPYNKKEKRRNAAPDGYQPANQAEEQERKDTIAHIERVRELLGNIMEQVEQRAEEHDLWKLSRKELPNFTEAKKLKTMTYNTPEYKEALKELGPALEHHYSKYRHHPEYHENGVDDMNLVDLIEMIADWKAAGERHRDGNIFTSINENKKRFKMSKQLCKVLWNTAKDVLKCRPGKRTLEK
jgi:hypothetical protein